MQINREFQFSQSFYVEWLKFILYKQLHDSKATLGIN